MAGTGDVSLGSGPAGRVTLMQDALYTAIAEALSEAGYMPASTSSERTAARIAPPVHSSMKNDIPLAAPSWSGPLVNTAKYQQVPNHVRSDVGHLCKI